MLKNLKIIAFIWLSYTFNISFTIHVHNTVPETIYWGSPNVK